MLSCLLTSRAANPAWSYGAAVPPKQDVPSTTGSAINPKAGSREARKGASPPHQPQSPFPPWHGTELLITAADAVPDGLSGAIHGFILSSR